MNATTIDRPTAASTCKADIPTRGQWERARPAVNIKIHAWGAELDNAARAAAVGEHTLEPDQVDAFVRWAERLRDDDWETYQTWWDLACADAFEHAAEDATMLWGDNVKCWQDGRSGGWLVVDGLEPVETWDAIAFGRWQTFERYCAAYVADVPYLCADLLLLNVWGDVSEYVRPAEPLMRGLFYFMSGLLGGRR